MSYVTLQNRLPAIVAELRPALDAVVARGAEKIEARARTRVPVATGKLRDAIHTQRLAPSRYAVVAGDDDAWYGHFVEFGTNKLAPHPFLVPAFEESRDGIVRDLVVTVEVL